MPDPKRIKKARFREFIWQVHLWSGLLAAALVIPISLTGSYLVWHVQIDEALSSNRALEAPVTPALSPSEYLKKAREAFPDANPAMLGMPESPLEPVNVALIFPDLPEPGAQQPRVFTWLHPEDGRLLDANDSREAFIAWAHRFHFYLTSHPKYGRWTVGLMGFFLVVSCLTALYLYWPKIKNPIWLTWRPTFSTSRNLHFVIGIWLLIPTLLISVTGIYLAFPAVSKALVGSVADIREPIGLPEPAPSRALEDLRLKPEEVISLAGASTDNFMMIGIPSKDSEHWRVLYKPEGAPPKAVMVDDRDGSLSAPKAPPEPLAGDKFTHLMHAIHDGQSWGIVYQTLIVIVGLVPGLFLVTGVTLWVRRRAIAQRKLAAQKKLATAA